MTQLQGKKHPSNGIVLWALKGELLLAEMLREDFLEEVAFQPVSGEDFSVSDGGVTPPGDGDSHADPGNQGTHIDRLRRGLVC